MMPNNPKQAYCTKFLLRMRTQPPVKTHNNTNISYVMAPAKNNVQCYLNLYSVLKPLRKTT